MQLINLSEFLNHEDEEKFSFFRGSPALLGLSLSLLRLRDHRQTTLGRTPLDEWSAHRRDLYLTKHNTDKRQTFMTPAGFEPAIPASRRPQTHVLDGAATGIGMKRRLSDQIRKFGAGRNVTWAAAVPRHGNWLRGFIVSLLYAELQKAETSSLQNMKTGNH